MINKAVQAEINKRNRRIRYWRGRGKTVQWIAEKFGLSKSRCWAIVRGMHVGRRQLPTDLVIKHWRPWKSTSQVIQDVREDWGSVSDRTVYRALARLREGLSS